MKSALFDVIGELMRQLSGISSMKATHSQLLHL